MAIEQDIAAWLEKQSVILGIQDIPGREALLFRAGLNEVDHIISLEGATGVFCQNLIHYLRQYGLLSDERDPVISVLEAAKTQGGRDRRKECDALLRRWTEQSTSTPYRKGNSKQVFICYSRKDREAATQLYQVLQDAGLTPWLDCKDLLPGQKWRLIIPQAIRNSQYVLVLLSEHSLSHQGFIQKELRKALEVVDPLPPEQVFVIPVRLDDCEPLDDRLHELHWVDLFPSYEDGLRRILRVVCPEQAAGVERIAQATATVIEPEPTAAPLPKSATPSIIHLRSTPETVSKDDFKRVFKLTENREPQTYIENQYEDRGDVVVDHATGLMWQKSGSDWLFYKEVEKYISTLNAKRFAGFDDWRLPTIPELMSLLEPEKQSNELYIDPLFDKAQWWCWSADIIQIKGKSCSSSAWGVDFNLGGVYWYYFKGNDYVRVVRS